MSFTLSPVLFVQEAVVYYVLGDPLKLKGEGRGGEVYPAYNREGEFVGIYQVKRNYDPRAISGDANELPATSRAVFWVVRCREISTTV